MVGLAQAEDWRGVLERNDIEIVVVPEHAGIERAGGRVSEGLEVEESRRRRELGAQLGIRERPGAKPRTRGENFRRERIALAAPMVGRAAEAASRVPRGW